MSDITFCPVCGAPIEGERRFCSNCGTNIDSKGQETVSYQNTQQGFGNVSPVQYDQPGYGAAPVPPYNDQQGFENVPPAQYNQPGYGSAPPPQYYQPNFDMYPMQQKNNSDGAMNGCAITGMVLGIISIVLCCLSWIGIVIGAAGIVLSTIGMRSYRFKGCAVAGLACSIAGTLLALVETIVIFME